MTILVAGFFALSLVILLGVLGLGLFSMARGAEFSHKYSNKIMQLRILIQFVALLSFIILLALLG